MTQVYAVAPERKPVLKGGHCVSVIKKNKKKLCKHNTPNLLSLLGSLGGDLSNQCDYFHSILQIFNRCECNIYEQHFLDKKSI